MRLYGQSMVILPDNPGEMGAGDKHRKDFPVPDEFGGQIMGPREFVYDVWTDEEIQEWSSDEYAEYDLVEWGAVVSE